MEENKTPPHCLSKMKVNQLEIVCTTEVYHLKNLNQI